MSTVLEEYRSVWNEALDQEREIYDRLLNEGFKEEHLDEIGIDKLTPDEARRRANILNRLNALHAKMKESLRGPMQMYFVYDVDGKVKEILLAPVAEGFPAPPDPPMHNFGNNGPSNGPSGGNPGGPLGPIHNTITTTLAPLGGGMSSPPTSAGLSTGATVGIIIAAILGFLILILLIAFLTRRRRRQEAKKRAALLTRAHDNV
jgi:hypothetical protein